MILPTKGISPDRSLLDIGANILSILYTPMNVSEVWDCYQKLRKRRKQNAEVTFDWFVLALDFLYVSGAIDLDDKGRLVKKDVSQKTQL